MIRIAVFDDEKNAIYMIVRKIKEIEPQLNVEFEIDTFTDATSLLNAFNTGQYQALFLDLDMPEKTGFEVSSYLRENRNEIPIVYITNRDDLMQRAFQYSVLGFVCKNRIDQELQFAIECVIREIQKNSHKIAIISSQKQKKICYDLNVCDIMYIECSDHHTMVYQNGIKKPIIAREPLFKYIEKPGFENFIQISASCIVNHKFIFSIERDTLILTDETVLYISRRKTKTIKEKWLIYIVGCIPAFIISIILATIISFLFYFIIGILAFWLMVTWSVNMLLSAVHKLLSGSWIPLWLFPEKARKIVELLPFSQIYYSPVSIQ